MRALALLVLAMSMSCNDTHYADEVRAWRAKRLERLKGEDSWLTLAGLAWLEPGDRSVGSDPLSDVPLPKSAPARVGVIHYAAGAPLRLECAPGVTVLVGGKPVSAVELATDSHGATPTVVQLGAVRFQVIERNQKLAVRVKDADSPVRTGFRGIESYEIDPSWRLVASWEPYDPPHPLMITNVLGWQESEPCPGAAVFDKDGQRVRLEPTQEDDQLFFVFGDPTNGKETYGAGRFLYASLPKDGKVVLDFNEAYNPPCAFTPYATCPIPSKENRLPFPVRAGEKKYGDHH